MKISCIIPIFNDSQFLVTIFKVLEKIEIVDEVICVVDGSNDIIDISNYSFKNIQLIIKKKNSGKASAIKTGLELCSYDNILIIDGDLINLEKSNLEYNIKEFWRSNPDVISMVVTTKYMNFKPNIWEIRLCGIKLLSKEILNEALRKKMSGYQLELTIDHTIKKNSLNHMILPLYGNNPSKLSKWGFLVGTLKNYEMFTDVLWTYYYGRIISYIDNARSFLMMI